MSRWIRIAALIVAVALGSAACGGETPQAPAGPTTAGVSSVTQGATISGTVSAGSTLGAMSTQVVGTSISSPVGAGGEFSLVGVPEGSVQLRFVGSGVDASVALGPVKTGDVVNLLVGLSGATATIQSESRNSSGKIELEGLIESRTPSTAIVVAGRTVTIVPSTVIRDDSGAPKEFTDFAVGQRVHVSGTLVASILEAKTITIQDGTTTAPEPPQDDSASVEDVLKRLSGAPPTLLIGTTTVTTTASTVVQRRGDVQTFATLAVGQTIHAVGTRMPDKSIAARMLQIKDDATGGTFVIEGSLGGLKGPCPAITFGVNGYSVVANAATFANLLSTPCSDLKNGTKVGVTGNRQAEGSVLATTVTKK
jgi:hypothetical protein